MLVWLNGTFRQIEVGVIVLNCDSMKIDAVPRMIASVGNQSFMRMMLGGAAAGKADDHGEPLLSLSLPNAPQAASALLKLALPAAWAG